MRKFAFALACLFLVPGGVVAAQTIETRPHMEVGPTPVPEANPVPALQASPTLDSQFRCFPSAGPFTLTFPNRGYSQDETDKKLAKLMQEPLVTLRYNQSVDGTNVHLRHVGEFPALYSTGYDIADSLWMAARNKKVVAAMTFGAFWAELTTRGFPAEIDPETRNYIIADVKRLQAQDQGVYDTFRTVSYDLRMRYIQRIYDEIINLESKLRYRDLDAQVAARELPYGVAFGLSGKLCDMTEKELLVHPDVVILRYMPYYTTPEYRHRHDLAEKRQVELANTPRPSN